METGIDKRISAGFCFEPAIAAYVEAAEKDLATVVGEATEEFSLFQDGENLAVMARRLWEIW